MLRLTIRGGFKKPSSSIYPNHLLPSGGYPPLPTPACLCEILVDIPDITVQLDSLLCEVVLDNAVRDCVDA